MTPLIWTLIQALMTVAPTVEAIARQRWGRQDATEVRDAAAEREALQHAWQAFEFHSRQRSLGVGAFVIGLAILAAAYTVALTGDLPVLAAVLGGAGMAGVLFFNRFDAVNRAQLHTAERALRGLEERLALAAAAPEIVLAPGGRSRLYQDALVLALQLFSFFAFLIAAVYALLSA